MGRSASNARLTWVVVALLGGGCSKREPPTPVKVTDAEAAAIERTGVNGVAQLLHRRGGKRAQVLCEDLECTDAQRDMITAAFAETLAAGPRTRRGPATNAAANAALGAAFETAVLSPTALTDHHAAVAVHTQSVRSQRHANVTTLLLKVHASLEQEQRVALSTLVAGRGLQPLMGRAGLGVRLLGKAADPIRRATRLTERLCAPLRCTLDQQNALIDALAKLPPTADEEPQSARDALAKAVGSATLDETAVNEFFATQAKAAEESTSAKHAVWIEIHDVLTPQQRKTLATNIAERGPSAIAGVRGRARPRRRRAANK